MTSGWRLVALTLAAASVIAGVACGARSPHAMAPGPTPHDVIVLVPDDATGRAGRVLVSNAHGVVELGEAGAWTRVAAAAAPATPQRMSDAEMHGAFGDLLAFLPPAAATFTLYFRFDSEELTAESRAALPEILDAARTRPFAEVFIVGHTDRAGATEANIQLGLKRAQAVRDLLLDTRVAGEAIRVSSHGESEPLVATADNVFEPRNRRVEVTVR